MKTITKNKGFIVPAIIIIVAILLVGGLYLYSQNQKAQPVDVNGNQSGQGNVIQNNYTPPPSPSPITTNSGIEGTVTMGPTCPGPTRPGCEDQPYSTSFQLYSKTGPGDGAEKLVMTFKSDTNGKFTINVAPGTYEIRQASASRLPSMSPQAVVVKANSYTHVNLQFDSGIR